MTRQKIVEKLLTDISKLIHISESEIGEVIQCFVSFERDAKSSTFDMLTYEFNGKKFQELPNIDLKKTKKNQ